jgi:hypothetical protein
VPTRTTTSTTSMAPSAAPSSKTRSGISSMRARRAASAPTRTRSST